MHECGNCGTPATPEGRFCTTCGATLVAGGGASGRPAVFVPPLPVPPGAEPAPSADDPAPPVAEPARPVVEPARPVVEPAETPVVEPAASAVGPTTSGSLEPIRPATGARPARRRRSRLPLLAGALALLLLGIAGWCGFVWMQDRPVDQALAASQESYASVLHDLEHSSSIDDLHEAGDAATGARRSLEQQRRHVAARTDGYGAAVAAVLSDQSNLLSALSSLGAVTAESLESWADVARGIDRAVEQVARSSDHLRRIDKGAAQGLTDPRPATERTAAVVGGFAATSLGSTVGQLLGDLSEADSTAEVREIGERADDAGRSVDAALAGLAETSDEAADVVVAGRALTLLARLADLDVDTLAVWDEVHHDLVGTVASIAETERTGYRSIRRIDRVITGWQRQMADWSERAAAAERSAQSRRDQIDDYATSMRALFAEYGSLRTNLATDLRDLDADAQADPGLVDRLRDEAADRTDIAARARALGPVPAAMQEAHDDFIRLVREGARAAQAGREAADASANCMPPGTRSATPALAQSGLERESDDPASDAPGSPTTDPGDADPAANPCALRTQRGWPTLAAHGVDDLRRGPEVERAWNAAERRALNAVRALGVPDKPAL